MPLRYEPTPIEPLTIEDMIEASLATGGEM